MIEFWYSPLTPAEVQAKLNGAISSVPRAADWEILLQKPDNVFHGEAKMDSFHLSPASVHEKGHPTLEISGIIAVVKTPGSSGSHLTTRYRPGQVKLLVWVLMFAFFAIWILLTLLHFSKTRVISTAIVLPIFGLIGLAVFGLVYRKYVTHSRRLLQELLLLQAEAPAK